MFRWAVFVLLMSASIVAPSRSDFTVDDEIAYFNGAACSLLHNSVAAAASEALIGRSRPWAKGAAGIDQKGAEADALRSFAGLLSVEANCVVRTPSTSYAMSTAARNIPLQEGQGVVVLEDQFSSNVLPWQALCDRVGGRLLVAKRRGDGDWASSIAASADAASVGIVAVPQVHWADGSLIDLAAVAATCRAKGARLVLDLSQSLGVVEFDAQEFGDELAVVACCTHKWLLGPNNFALAYFAPDLHAAGQPLEDAAWTREGYPTVFSEAGYPTAFKEGAARFGGGRGGQANHITAPMLAAGLRVVTQWTPRRIAEATVPHSRRIAAAGRKLGFTVPERHSPHIVGFRLPSPTPCGWPPSVEDLCAALSTRGIIVSCKASALRISAHVYTSEVDVDRFCAALDELCPAPDHDC